MEHLGNTTKSIFLVGPESHKLSLEFEAVGTIGVITLSANLVADDSITGKINGKAVTAVAFATTHAAAMAALQTNIEKIAGVEKAWIDDKVITFVMASNTAPIVMTEWEVTSGGNGTATVTTSLEEVPMAPGTPVILIGAGEKVAPASLHAKFGIATATANLLGITLHGTKNVYKDGLVTVVVKGYVVTFGQCSSAVEVGPISHDGIDTTTGYNKYKTGVATHIIGLALDEGADTDIIRVLLF